MSIKKLNEQLQQILNEISDELADKVHNRRFDDIEKEEKQNGYSNKRTELQYKANNNYKLNRLRDIRKIERQPGTTYYLSATGEEKHQEGYFNTDSFVITTRRLKAPYTVVDADKDLSELYNRALEDFGYVDDFDEIEFDGHFAFDMSLLDEISDDWGYIGSLDTEEEIESAIESGNLVDMSDYYI